jgi:hypothetical protein
VVADQGAVSTSMLRELPKNPFKNAGLSAVTAWTDGFRAVGTVSLSGMSFLP